MAEKEKTNNPKKNEKTAGNNQWTNTHLDRPIKSERRDGPGGN